MHSQAIKVSHQSCGKQRFDDDHVTYQAKMNVQWHSGSSSAHLRSMFDAISLTQSVCPHPSQDVASMKTFELKPVLQLLNTFTSGVRESVLDVFQQVLW